MTFKIIECIEKGQKRLCIVPSAWESNGVLRWPKRRLDVNKLIKDENSKPLDNWSISNCSLKRPSLSSYDEAVRELDLMIQNSDTEIESVIERPITADNNDINLNDLAGQLVYNQPQTSTLSTSEAATAAEYVIQYVAEPDLASISVDTNTNVKQIENYLKTILDNQHNMIQTMNVLADNQKKILHKLAGLSVQIDDGFSQCNQTKNTDVVKIGESDPFENTSFTIKPIDSVRQLEEFESLLSDKMQKNQVLKQYTFVCSQSDGKGATCAYKVLDMFFSREFLCKCSWTGGSRNSDEVKVGLKGYKNILNFYYELIRFWDTTYTAEDNENFFKIVLKNSVKRKLSKNERASTKRMRTKKAALKNKNTSENQSGQLNQNTNQIEMDTNEKDIIDKDATNEK